MVVMGGIISTGIKCLAVLQRRLMYGLHGVGLHLDGQWGLWGSEVQLFMLINLRGPEPPDGN